MRKYRNIPTVVDGISFDSKAEARRYGELKLLQRAGQIAGLTLQPSFELTVNGKLIGRYVADFQYLRVNGPRVVEDVKSTATMTPIFRWKAKHMLAEHGVVVEIVK